MKLLRHLPNALTCCNLICGGLAIISLQLYGRPEFVAYFVWAACVFDFLDGFAARAFHVSSPIGKELDSLADMMSFGIVPAVTMFSMMEESDPAGGFVPIFLKALCALALAVFSALRLAKFNIDENQKDSFIGVPTPAMALFVTALPFLPSPIFDLVFGEPVMSMTMLFSITILFCYLMVCPLELFALKFKNFSLGDNKIRFTFLLLAVLLLAWLQAGAIPFIILLYIAISLVTRVLESQK